jgi:LEA14-like dessication related protein
MRWKWLIAAMIVLSCSTTRAGKEKEQPTFIKMKNSRIGSFSMDKIDIYSEAVLYNPYKVGLKIEAILVDVYVEDIKLGTVLNSEEHVKVYKQGTFDVPLRMSVKPAKTFNTLFMQSGRMLMGKKIEITYKGYIKVKALGFVPVKVPVNTIEYYDWNDIFPKGDYYRGKLQYHL